MVFSEAEERYRNYLKQHKLLVTQERLGLLRVIFAQQGHFSADELLQSIQCQGMDISRATLYRNLKQLVEAQILHEADFGHGHLHFEIASVITHGHLLCECCGKVLEFQSNLLEQVMEKVAQNAHFHLHSHQFKGIGICSDCHKKRMQP